MIEYSYDIPTVVGATLNSLCPTLTHTIALARAFLVFVFRLEDFTYHTMVETIIQQPSEESEASSPQQGQQEQQQEQQSTDACCASSYHSREQLEIFNLLVHPVWVFDIDGRAMIWANQAAVVMWNAESLDALVSRSFADMSESTILRLREYQSKFRKGERVKDQWTMYPKGQAKTIVATCSEIRLTHPARELMLVEAVPMLKEEMDPKVTRGVEMLRHLPVAVCQFDMCGQVMYQNPEATNVYGDTPSENNSANEEGSSEEEEKEEKVSEYSKRLDPTSHFLSRFVDKKLGERVFQEVQNAKDFSIDAQQYTQHGIAWSAIKVRQSLDPVTGKPVVLFSARDITEVIAAKKQTEANMKKSEFFAIMAHEIRTPLHQVTGFVDLLDQTHLDSEQRSFVRLLKSSACSLMTVINDVLDFSKLEAGKMKLEHIPFEPKAVVQGSMEAVRPAIEDKGLCFNLDWGARIPFKILGDPNRLRQILLNLLQNAAKFTPEGSVRVRVEHAKEKDEKGRALLKFHVADTGIGINPTHLKRIFVQYQQADPSIARQYGGTGLGLSICKYLVENMGGRIGVESELGVGTTFSFTIPCEVPEERATERQDDEGHAPHNEACTLHVLVAEDNIVNKKLVASMLKRMGHTAMLVENGKEAIDAIEHTKFDVILMDIQMPVMDGIEATRRLRSSGYNHLPIIGLTASVHRTDYEELGFNDWISKPVPMKDLKAKLYHIWQRKRLDLIYEQ